VQTAQPIDGRSARALRTREAIVDACVSLIEDGELRPTAPRVAERAGVSVRSVFQHFADLPALHSAVLAARQRDLPRFIRKTGFFESDCGSGRISRRVAKELDHRVSLFQVFTLAGLYACFLKRLVL